MGLPAMYQRCTKPSVNSGEGYPLRYSAHYILCRRFRRCEGGRGFVGAGAIPLVSVS
jgi:hypothetical protein